LLLLREMKVLFISTPSHDLASIFLYDGFCDLLGEESVVLAEHYPYLSFLEGGGGRILHGRKGSPRVLSAGEKGFNLVVLNACFNRDRDWGWASDLVNRSLTSDGVVAYVEGWDDPTNEVFPAPPTLPITRVFRREILPGHPYPYHATPLQWACPEWWLDEPREAKIIDVSCLCTPAPVQVRWPIMSKVFQTATRYCAVVGGGVPFEQYLWVTRRSKYVIIPPGGGSDCIRQWEAIGCGAVPIFVGHPSRVREPWFTRDEVIECGIEELPATLDYVLSAVDLPGMRDRLEKRARAEHTTKARAKRVIDLTGVVG
jgi:hypothetical protein